MNPTNRPIFLASDETKKVQALLETKAIGEITPWLEINDAAGGNQQKARGALVTARKHLLTERQMVFCAVRGVGLKRIADADVVKNEGMTSLRIGRQARASMKRLATVAPDRLKQQDKLAYSTVSASIGAVALCTSAPFRQSATQIAIANGNTPPAEVLKLFLRDK